MYANLKRLMSRYNQPVHVKWETTDLPYHANGNVRETGEFDANEADARAWAHRFVRDNPRGAVSIVPQ